MDTVITYRGIRLRRSAETGPRGGVRYLYQCVDASPTWGYWYSSAVQAARESGSTDRPVL
jgi:hypothetical protein